MDRYENLINRVAEGELIVIDGATGTEMERRGVPKLEHAWNGGGTLSHPEILCGIHEDYIRGGADIIISNTFATLKSALEDAGHGGKSGRDSAIEEVAFDYSFILKVTNKLDT